MVKKRFISNILVALVLMLTAIVITAGCGIKHHHHDDYNPYDQQSSSGDESNDNGGNSDNGSNDNGDNGGNGSNNGTDYSSVERVPDYKNTNPYKVIVTKVNVSPNNMTMGYTLNGQAGTVNGEVDGENVVFKVADPAASAQSEQDKTSNVNPKAEDESSQESGFVVKKIDIDEYTLSTNVEVDSDVRCFTFQFAELNNDNEDLAGDFIATFTNVEQKPMSASLEYSTNGLSALKKDCTKWVYNTQAKTVKFLIEDDELNSKAYVHGLCLDNRILVLRGNNEVTRSEPKELSWSYSQSPTSYRVVVTDANSSLPEHLTLSNMDKEVVYTTSEGVKSASPLEFTVLNNQFSFTPNKGMLYENSIVVNKLRLGNRLYETGFNFYYQGTGKALELDLSSGFEKVAIPYRAEVADCSADMKGVMTFKDTDDKEYRVDGNYDSTNNHVVFEFKSPSDKLNISLIQVDQLKSTAAMDFGRKTNLSPAGTRLLPFIDTDSLLSTKMMGTQGNTWVAAGCAKCGGSGNSHDGNLKPGTGKCPYGPCKLCNNTGNCTCKGGEILVLLGLN